jgi:hypothetical protein
MLIFKLGQFANLGVIQRGYFRTGIWKG